jgi:5'-3' exoribonuclease 1
MGIPAYFSHIVKTYPSIIKKFITSQTTIHNLYMDCNSIIYDAVRMSASVNSISKEYYIIHQVILKIENYIDTIKPQSNVIIAFDGVCPIAKMEQQRSRRYKSNISSSIMKNIMEDEKRLKNTNTKEDKQSHTEVYTEDFNTTCITPGTVFMKELNETVQAYYKKERLLDPDPNTNLDIIVSSSFDYGEGEHKIFQYIRSHPDEHKEGTTIVYGLDADLIMLSINHLPLCPHIYLFRETPEFIKSIDASLEPNEHYILDIPALTQEIMSCMTREDISTNTIAQKNKIHDYIFLCFFLGNDFLPHFPAVNIRTGGVDKMLNAYKATITDNEWLTDGNTIVWKNVRKMVQYLAEQEEEIEYIKEIKDSATSTLLKIVCSLPSTTRQLRLRRAYPHILQRTKKIGKGFEKRKKKIVRKR